MNKRNDRHEAINRLVEVLEHFVEAKVNKMDGASGIQEYIALEDWRKELRVVLHDVV